MDLRHLTDKALLEDTKALARREREITLKVLHHLKELERRKLFSDLGYRSLFDYAVKELGYSNAAAGRRIQSARLMVELPFIEAKILEGTLSLSNVAQASCLFQNEEIEAPTEKLAILKEIENKSSRECEKILLAHQSEPDVPKERIKQTTAALTTVKFNFSESTMSKFNELKDILASHRYNYNDLFNRIFTEATDMLKSKKFKTNAKLSPAPVPPSEKRYISNFIKRQVYERDQGQCTKCGSKRDLEYDHIKPFSMGGKSTIKNLRLLCRNCNLRSGITGRIINKAQRVV